MSDNFGKENRFELGRIMVEILQNMIKQNKPLQTRYDMTYTYARYYIRTHVYMFLFSVKKRVFELSRV